MPSKRRELTELERLAIVVAIAAPARFSKWGRSTYIPRGHVDKIRAECERVGIDWRKLKRDCDREWRGRAAKRAAEAAAAP